MRREMPKDKKIGSLRIANEYLQGRLESHAAVTELLWINTCFSKLLAGEISLDRAARAEQHMVSTHLSQANRNFHKTIEHQDNRLTSGGLDIMSRIRAGVRLAQFSLNGIVYGKKRLPDPGVVRSAYEALIGHSVRSVEALQVDANNGRRSSAERQALGEAAVLLLAQRYALREVGVQEWLPAQSLFSEDRGRSCLVDSSDFTWDMNIFTPSQQAGNPPERTYALKIIRDSVAETKRGPTVAIHPDLAVVPKEIFIPEKIIAACGRELKYPKDSARLTHELDARTELFLDVIDR